MLHVLARGLLNPLPGVGVGRSIFRKTEKCHGAPAVQLGVTKTSGLAYTTHWRNGLSFSRCSRGLCLL